jgi:hypothetical protein
LTNRKALREEPLAFAARSKVRVRLPVPEVALVIVSHHGPADKSVLVESGNMPDAVEALFATHSLLPPTEAMVTATESE